MEYILIFISAIFVNNIVLSQFLGICPVPGCFQEGGNSDGYECGSCFRADYRYHRHIPDSEVCVGRFRIGVLTDNHFYSGYCRTGADGRNYSEESFLLLCIRHWVCSYR